MGGVLANDEVTVVFGGTYGELPEPIREGYTFNGWYTSETGGELVEAGTEVSDKTAHTLYAHWTLTKVFSVTVPGWPAACRHGGRRGHVQHRRGHIQQLPPVTCA